MQTPQEPKLQRNTKPNQGYYIKRYNYTIFPVFYLNKAEGEVFIKFTTSYTKKSNIDRVATKKDTIKYRLEWQDYQENGSSLVEGNTGLLTKASWIDGDDLEEFAEYEVHSVFDLAKATDDQLEYFEDPERIRKYRTRAKKIVETIKKEEPDSIQHELADNQGDMLAKLRQEIAEKDKQIEELTSPQHASQAA